MLPSAPSTPRLRHREPVLQARRSDFRSSIPRVRHLPCEESRPRPHERANARTVELKYTPLQQSSSSAVLDKLLSFKLTLSTHSHNYGWGYSLTVLRSARLPLRLSYTTRTWSCAPDSADEYVFYTDEVNALTGELKDTLNNKPRHEYSSDTLYAAVVHRVTGLSMLLTIYEGQSPSRIRSTRCSSQRYFRPTPCAPHSRPWFWHASSRRLRPTSCCTDIVHLNRLQAMQRIIDKRPAFLHRKNTSYAKDALCEGRLIVNISKLFVPSQLRPQGLVEVYPVRAPRPRCAPASAAPLAAPVHTYIHVNVPKQQ